MIDNEKLIPKKNPKGIGVVTTVFYGKVNRKILKVGNILKGTLADDKKRFERKKSEDKKNQRKEEEDRIETNDQELKNPSEKKSPSIPKVGILGWFKNFIGKILLGFFAARLLDFLPTLSKLLPVFGAAVNFVSSIGVGIVDAFGTFVNIAYSAADATKGFIKAVGGEKTLEIFENFSGVISTLIDVLILSALVSRGRDDDGFGRGRRGRRRGPRPDIDGPGRKKKGRGRRGRRGKFGTRELFSIREFLRFRKDKQAKIRQRALKALQRKESVDVAKELFAKKKIKAEEMRTVIDQVQQGKKRLIIRKKTLAAPELTTKEVLSTPVGAGAGPVTRPFERKGFRAPGFLGPEAEKIYKESTRAEGQRIKASEIKKRSAIVKFDPSVELGMTDVDDAIFDSIDNDPKLNTNQKSQAKANYFTELQKRNQLRDIEFKKRFGIDLEMEKFSKAQFDQQVAQMEGFDPKIRRSVRTGEDDLLDAIAKAPPSRKTSFLKGLRRFTSKFKLPIIGALIDFGLSWMLGEHPGRAAFKAIGAGILGGAFGIIGNVIPVVGGLLGGLAGGVLGDMAGGALFDFLFSKRGSRGTTEYRNEGGMIGEGKSRRKLTEPPPERPKAITFDQSDKGPFASKTAADLVRDENIDLSKLDYFGPILALSAKLLTGERPENSDYRNASLGLNLLFKDGFKSGELVGNIDVSTGINLAKWIEKSLITRAFKPFEGLLTRIKNFILGLGNFVSKAADFVGDKAKELLEKVLPGAPAQAKTSDNQGIGDFFNTLLNGAYNTGLKTGPRGSIGVGDEYHIDTKILKSLPMEQKIAMVDQLARGYAARGRKIEFSNSAVAGMVYDVNASPQQKAALLNKAFGAHSHSRHSKFDSLDYYIPTMGETRFGKSAEGAEILSPTVDGGSLEFHQGGGYGAFTVLLDKDGNVISKTGHGDIRGAKSGTVKLGDQMTKDLSTLKEPASYEDERASNVVVVNKRNLISYVQKTTTSPAPVTQSGDSYDPFSILYS
tara:strand:- start:1445 stop:4459 length:3015 start_codon:yes stop_codon:yes gene_type:complete